MKILLITTTFPTPQRPNQGAFNQTFVDALSAKHAVHVIAPVPWFQRFANSPANPKKDNTSHPTFFYPPKILRRFYGVFYWISIRSTVSRLPAAFSPDVVMGYWIHPDGVACNRAAKLLGVPSVLISGGTDLKLLPSSGVRRTQVLDTIAAANRLMVVSQDLAATAVERGVARDHIEVVYRPVDRTIFYPRERSDARIQLGISTQAIFILWVGRLEPVKNPELLLQAAKQWKQRWGHRLRILMIGDGSLRTQLMKIRRQLELHDVLEIQPSVPHSQLGDYYGAADLTVLTSRSEGVPNVLLESLACGTPFVASNVGGVPEIANQDLDSLFPSGDVASLIDAVNNQIEKRGSQAGNSPPREFQPSTPEAMAEQVEHAIAQAILDWERKR